FYGIRYLPVLHSFPTRRSSDLASVIRVLHCTAVWHGAAGHVMEAGDTMGRLPGIARRHDFVRHDVCVDAKGGPSEMGADLCAVADRKSTRLNSSHLGISYAVFC